MSGASGLSGFLVQLKSLAGPVSASPSPLRLRILGKRPRLSIFPIISIFSLGALGAGISYHLTGHWLATPLLLLVPHSMDLEFPFTPENFLFSPQVG